MSNAIHKLEKIKKNLEAVQSKRDILTGKAEAAMEELKKHGFDSVEEANKALDKLDKEADKISAKLEKLIAEFNEKYPELSGDSDGQD